MEVFYYICKVFALDDFESFCVEKAFLAEFEDREGDEGARFGEYLTPGALLKAWGKDMELAKIWRAFSENSTLMRYFLVQEKGSSLLWGRLFLHPRMLEMLVGEAKDVPEDWKGVIELALPQGREDAINQGIAGDWQKLPEDEGRADPPVKKLSRLLQSRRPEESWLIELCGPEGSGRRHTARALFEGLKKPLLIGNISGKNRNDVLRECIFFQAGLMLAGGQQEMDVPGLKQLFSCFPVIFLASEKKHFYPEEKDWLSVFCIEMEPPGFLASASLWREALEGVETAPDVSFEEMAGKYTLYPGTIMGAAALARARARMEGRSVVSREDLSAGCHELLCAGMGKKALPVRPGFSWDMLVLPEYQKKQLQTICSQIRQKNRLWDMWDIGGSGVYGRGISVVFSGLPGTGKTMAAQVAARALGMDLYRVDLAAVVSKYIGETEKNLEEIFEQAKGSQAILFFDEADVLFSKRTEVKSSNDKYSNMEAAYMLQKIESYDGITILSTNYLQNFDEAFKRRMKMIIDFPFPDEAGRERLWSQVFPGSVRVSDDMDYDYLAKQFELSGSNIKNAAMFAAFLAMEEDRAVSMGDVAAGIKNEYAKLGKILRPEDAGEYYMLF